MKIAIVFYDINRTAGIQRSICNTANLLTEKGHEVTIVTAVGGLPAFDVSKDVEFSIIDLPELVVSGGWVKSLFFRIAKILWSMIFFFKLYAFIGRWGGDIIIDNGTALGLIYPVRRLRQAKFFLHRHFSINDFPFSFFINLYWRIFCKNKNFIVLDELYKRQLFDLGLNNVAVVHNMAPVAKKILGEFCSKRIILAVGRATSQKGFDLLINAFAKLPADENLLLRIIGPGVNESEELIRLVKSFGLTGKVELLGASSCLDFHYAEATLICMPSRWEGVPFVLLESIAYGKPILLSNIDIFESISGKSDAGIVLFDLKKPADLALKLKEMLYQDDVRGGGVNAKKIYSYYSKEYVAKQWQSVLIGNE